jgi:hypothetical protein
VGTYPSSSEALISSISAQGKCGDYKFANDEFDSRISPLSDVERSTRAREIFDKYFGDDAEEAVEVQEDIKAKLVKSFGGRGHAASQLREKLRMDVRPPLCSP